MRRLLIVSVLLAGALAAGACRQDPSGPQEQARPASDSASTRFHNANGELNELLRQAADLELDVHEFRGRHSQATLTSATSMVRAAEEMEQIVRDLRERVEKARQAR